LLEELRECDAMLENITEITSLEKDVQISPWSEKNFKDALSADNLFKIFKYKKKLVGFYVALFAADECQLLNIAVKSQHQNKGIGQKLLTSLKKNCRSFDVASIFLEVRASNKMAIKLYEKNGFNELGIRNNYYKIGDNWENGILMGAEL
jgi:ribosomal-protein-alanine N-acetyltransferase